MTGELLSDLRYAIDNLRMAVDRGSLVLADHYCEKLEVLYEKLDPTTERIPPLNHEAARAEP